MIKKILTAVDNSARAPSVLAAAVEIGEKFDASVLLFRVIAIPQEFPAAGANEPDSMMAALEQRARDELVALAQGQARTTILPLEVFAGQPWRAIVLAAEQNEVDLIVIGSHGYSGWDRILGTTASKVSDHADRNVLVVHPRRP